jgi:hypothetical protein
VQVSLNIHKTNEAEEHVYEVHHSDGKVLFWIASSSPTKHKKAKVGALKCCVQGRPVVTQWYNTNFVYIQYG